MYSTLTTRNTLWQQNLTFLACLADVEEDEVLFSIPRSAVFNLNNALSVLPTGPMQEAITAMPSWLVRTLPSDIIKG